MGKTLGKLPFVKMADQALFGKKIAGTADSYSTLDPAQQDLMSRYKGMLNDNSDTAGAQIAQQENSAIQGAKDAEMRVNQNIAQRGLEGSSVGLSGVINASRGLGDQLGAIRAQRPALQQSNEFNKLNNINQGINSILGSRIFTQGQKGGRSGGLAPVIGAVAGGMMGGAGGAQIGAQLGGALQTARG